MTLIEKEALRERIIEQLTAIGGRLKRDEVLIRCLWHNDNNPSLGVHVGHKVTPGTYHCWSCGASGGWNTLAQRLNLPGADTGLSEAAKKAIQENPFGILQRALSKSNVVASPRELHGTEPLPKGFQWRGWGKKFLENYGARYWWQRDIEKDIEMEWLYFPLTMAGQYVGYTICALRPHKPKYLVFADTTKTFFLYDFIPAGSPVVLVEGHSDCLRLHAEGIPAIAMFGLENWGPVKREYLRSKQPSKVVVLLDGDPPGPNGAPSHAVKVAMDIYCDLRTGMNADIMYLPPAIDKTTKLDPGNMPQEYVEELRRRLCP